MAKDKTTAGASLFRSRRDFTKEPPADVGLPVAAAVMAAPPAAMLPTPNGVPMHIFAGPGYSGKSFVAKYIIDMAIADGKTLGVAEMDPAKRELVRRYGPEAVMQPTDGEVPTTDPAQVVSWLVRYLDWLLAQKPVPPTLLEFGGGDTALIRLVTDMPDLLGTLQASGVAPVLWHFLTPRVEDLGTLATLEKLGFKPPAMVLVTNDALLRQTDHAEAFGRVQAHPVYRRALDAGAVPLRVPALSPELAAEVDHGMGFTAYNAHLVSQGFGGLMMRAMDGWVTRMRGALAPVEAYLP